MAADQAISFGPFRLLPSRQMLFKDDKPIRLGSRAVDVLVALVERTGEIVTKEELLALVWPTTHVEENNLRVHIAAVRRALGDGQAGNRFISNIPGRGYRFIAPVSISRDAEPSLLPAAVERPHNLPAPLTRVVGRAVAISEIVARLPQWRLITIVGAGGIGKTTVALSAAEEVMNSYQDGVRFIDLAPLSDPNLVPSALASVLGVAIHSEDTIPQLIAFLREKRMLILLDNCERLVNAVAALAHELLNGAGGVHILATSREPLRAESERVLRLSALELPPVPARLKAAEALSFSAVELFVERASVSMNDFVLSDETAPIAAEICRRLDGIPLAIELAASRVDTFGVQGLATLLDDRFKLLMRSRRKALLRHQTLLAAIDWSYEVLSEQEKILLCRLAVFVGNFSLDAAIFVTTDASLPTAFVLDGLETLVAKSLVSADVGGATVQYRLLASTRAFALDKLAEIDERARIESRHAEYYRNRFLQAAIESLTRPAAEWLAIYGLDIDNAQAALDWAFSPDGDPSAGVALTIASAPHWFQFSHMEDYRKRIERALSSVRAGSNSEAGLEIQLLIALALSMRFIKGGEREAGEAWAKALELAEAHEELQYRLRALWGLWSHLNARGEMGAALTRAEEFSKLAALVRDQADLSSAELMMGVSHHYLGNQTAARHHIERMLEWYPKPAPASQTIRFHFDPEGQARTFLARVLWLQGFPDQAMRVVRSFSENSRLLDHPPTACNALALAACPIALQVGDLAAAEGFLEMLFRRSAIHALDLWGVWAQCTEGVLLIKRGELANGLPQLQRHIEKLRDTAFTITTFLGSLAEGLSSAGHVPEAMAAINEALARSTRSEGHWPLAELLRIKGALLLAEGASGAAAAAEAQFMKGIELSRQQGALSWELRCATNLALLWRDLDRHEEALAILAPVYEKFVEGHTTSDLKSAKALIDDLKLISDSRNGRTLIP